MVYMNFVAKRLFDAAMARHAAEWYGISKAEGLALGNKGQVQKIAENLRALQRGLTGDRARVASGYMDEKSALQAYLLYYWPVLFMKQRRFWLSLRSEGHCRTFRLCSISEADPGRAVLPQAFSERKEQCSSTQVRLRSMSLRRLRKKAGRAARPWNSPLWLKISKIFQWVF